MTLAYTSNMNSQKALTKIAQTDEKRTSGRPPKNVIDDDTKEKLINNALAGLTRITNRSLLGISDKQFERLLKNAEFSRKFIGAEQAFLASVQKKVIDSAISTVDGARWLLERRQAEEFGTKSKVQVEETKPVRVVLKRFSRGPKK